MPILRESCDGGQLPDEMIEVILENVPTLQLIAFGWDGVSHGLRSVIRRILSKRTKFDTTDKENWSFFNVFATGTNVWQHSKLLSLIAFKHFHNLSELCIDIGTLRTAQQMSSISFDSLESLTVKMGDVYGGRNSEGLHSFQKFVDHCIPSASLSHISIELTLLSDDNCASVAEFRDLVRSLSTRTAPHVSWELHFLDKTTDGQKWLSPVQLCTQADVCVVSYVRAMQLMDIRIQRINIVDCSKTSPYMLVGSITKRRSLYMWHEYKECEYLSIDYDVGMVSPNFGIGIHNFSNLKIVEIQSSHVLYKKDFLEYLNNAPNLEYLRVIAPSSFPRRVSQCKSGCFLSSDYACFRPDGWCQIMAILPKVELDLQHGAVPSAPVSCNVSVQIEENYVESAIALM